MSDLVKIIISILLYACFAIGIFHAFSLPILLKYKKVLENWEYVNYLRTDEGGNHNFILSKNNIDLCTIKLEFDGDFYINDEINNELYIRPLGYFLWQRHIRKKLLEKVPENLRSTKFEKKNFTKYL